MSDLIFKGYKFTPQTVRLIEDLALATGESYTSVVVKAIEKYAEFEAGVTAAKNAGDNFMRDAQETVRAKWIVKAASNDILINRKKPEHAINEMIDAIYQALVVTNGQERADLFLALILEHMTKDDK